MPDKSWKRWERTVAAELNGDRNVGSGVGSIKEDVIHPHFAVECKYGARAVPKFIGDALGQAVKASVDTGKTPLLCCKRAGAHGGIAVMRFSDFVELARSAGVLK
jgi:hypothetical protein